MGEQAVGQAEYWLDFGALRLIIFGGFMPSGSQHGAELALGASIRAGSAQYAYP